MKNVLWISRHALTAEQTAGLERFCGGSFSLRQWAGNVETMEALAPLLAEADVIAAVLPPQLLAELVRFAGDKPVLIDVAKRELVHRDGQEPTVRFGHGGWHRIGRLELALEPVE